MQRINVQLISIVFAAMSELVFVRLLSREASLLVLHWLARRQHGN